MSVVSLDKMTGGSLGLILCVCGGKYREPLWEADKRELSSEKALGGIAWYKCQKELCRVGKV